MGLPIGVYSPFEMSFRDKGGEQGRFRVYGLLITADNFDANQALATALRDKLHAATLGVIVEWSYGGILNVEDPVADASSASAQRENKLLVRYHDVTTLKKLSASIPTINLPGLAFLSEANDFVSLVTPSFISDLVTAWNDFVVNPETGNAVAIDSMEYVGRNS